jgi:hypothetical protein
MFEKVRENRSRRKAQRLGLQLKKSRGKEWSIDNQLGYMIVLTQHDKTVYIGERYELDLDDVEAYLDEYEKKLRDTGYPL